MACACSVNRCRRGLVDHRTGRERLALRAQPAQNGVSHFIEHLLFKGTRNARPRKSPKRFDAVGGVLNAFTGKEYTCYYAKVLGADLPMTTELLADLFLESVFDRGRNRSRAPGGAAGNLAGRGHSRRFHPRPVQSEVLGRPSAGAADFRIGRDRQRDQSRTAGLLHGRPLPRGPGLYRGGR